MGALLLETLPYAVAAAVAAPAAAVVSALILGTAKRPILGAWLFTGAAATLDAIVAAVVLAAFWGSADDASGDIGAWIDVVLGLMFIALGVWAVFHHDSPEQQAVQQARIEGFLARGLRGIVLIGLVVQVINFDAIAVFAGGLKEIIAAQPPIGQTVVVVAVMLAVMLVPYYGPAVYAAARGEGAKTALGHMSNWILRNSRMLEIVVGIGYGGIFLVKGVTAL